MKKCTIEIKDRRVEVPLPFSIGSSLDDTICLNDSDFGGRHFYIFDNNMTILFLQMKLCYQIEL